MIFVLFPIRLRFFKNKFFIEQRRHSKHISDGEYICDKISCLRSYLYNFLALLHREVPHELVDPGFPEEFLRVLTVDTPTEGEVDGSFPVVLVVQAHQLPERQASPGCLGPDILLAEAPVRQLQPRGLRHLAVTGT